MMVTLQNTFVKRNVCIRKFAIWIFWIFICSNSLRTSMTVDAFRSSGYRLFIRKNRNQNTIEHVDFLWKRLCINDLFQKMQTTFRGNEILLKNTWRIVWKRRIYRHKSLSFALYPKGASPWKKQRKSKTRILEATAKTKVEKYGKHMKKAGGG